MKELHHMATLNNLGTVDWCVRSSHPGQEGREVLAPRTSALLLACLVLVEAPTGALTHSIISLIALISAICSNKWE